MTRKYELTEAEATLAFQQISTHCASLKNWMVSAIEREDFEAAKQYVAELRIHQKLFAKLNVEAHRIIDTVGSSQ